MKNIHSPTDEYGVRAHATAPREHAHAAHAPLTSLCFLALRLPRSSPQARSPSSATHSPHMLKTLTGARVAPSTRALGDRNPLRQAPSRLQQQLARRRARPQAALPAAMFAFTPLQSALGGLTLGVMASSKLALVGRVLGINGTLNGVAWAAKARQCAHRRASSSAPRFAAAPAADAHVAWTAGLLACLPACRRAAPYTAPPCALPSSALLLHRILLHNTRFGWKALP